jgi:hypothetical protein
MNNPSTQRQPRGIIKIELEPVVFLLPTWIAVCMSRFAFPRCPPKAICFRLSTRDSSASLRSRNSRCAWTCWATARREIAPFYWPPSQPGSPFRSPRGTILNLLLMEKRLSAWSVLNRKMPSSLRQFPLALPRRYPLEPGERYHSVEFSGMADRFLVQLFDDLGALRSYLFESQSGGLSQVPGMQYVSLISPSGVWGVLPGGSELRLAHLETGEIRSICGLRTGWSPVERQ